MADVKLVTKFVDLGSTGGYGFALYGFRNIGGTFGTFGTLSETANGSSNTTTSYLYSTSTDIKEVYWADQTTDTLYFTLDGNRSNSALVWAKLKIGSTTFTRSSATYSYNSSTDRTTWSWATNTNPFGSTTNGTDVSVEVILDVNTGHTSSSTSKTITAGSTSDETYTFSNASSNQKYRLVKSSGTIASGGANGTVIDSRTGGGTLTIDYSNNELPTAGNNATYQLQVSGGNVSPTETESGFWINTTGQNNSLTITRESSAPTYSLSASPTTVNEGSSVTFTASTTNVSQGTTLYFRAVGIPASGSAGAADGDYSPTTGSDTVDSNGQATFTTTVTADNTTEGTEYFRGQVFTDSSYSNQVGSDANVTINDTSTTPPSYTVTAPTYIAEGSSGTFTVTTTNVSNGTTLYWSLVDATDFNTATGTVTINSNSGSFNGTATADFSTEGVETGTVRVRTGSQGGTIVATDTFTIYDTSRAAIAPTDITFGTDPGTQSATVSITATASGGANGTMYVSDTDPNVTNSVVVNGSSFNFTRGTAKTIYAVTGNGGGLSSTYSESFTADYLTVDTKVDLSPANTTISYSSTSSATISLTNGTANHRYRLRSGTATVSTILLTGTSGTFTVANSWFPTSPGSTTLTLQGRVDTAYGGDNAYDNLDDTVTLTRQDSTVTAPIGITFGSVPATASATVSVTVTATGGTFHTQEVSEDGTNWVANGSSFNFTRGTEKTVYARNVSVAGTNVSSSLSSTLTPGYLVPSGLFSKTNDVISFDATSATTTISDGSSTDTYAVRVDNGSTNLASRTGNGDITFTSELPSVGSSTVYEIFRRRPVSTGGDGSTFYGSNLTFSVIRSAEGVTAPTDITFGSDPGTASATVSITATASGGSGGTLQVSADGSTWVSNGSSFTFTRGTSKTIYARRSGSGSVSSNYTEAHTVGYISPDLNVSVSRSPSGNLAPNSTDDVIITISNGTANNRYRVLRTTGGNTGLGNTGNLSGTSGTVTLHNADANDLPTTGNTVDYVIQGRVDTAKGGNNTYGSTNASFSITRSAEDVTPNDFSFTDFTNVARSTTQTSSTITVGGLSTGTSVTVSVTGGTYSKNYGSYTSSNGTASNGDTFSVRHTSSGSFSTDTDTTLTIGNKNDTFTTTTLAADTVPDAFSFTDATNQPLGALTTSTEITIAGLNTSTTVSVTGGEYSKNEGTYTSSNGTASNGDTFTLRHTTSTSYSTATNTVLNIGGVTDTWSTTTIAEGNTETGGGGGSSTGSGNYGIEVYGPDGTTVVWGSNVRQTNIVIYELLDLANGSSKNYTCADANDDTKVKLITAFPSYIAGPFYQSMYGQISTSTTSTGFTVTNSNSNNTNLSSLKILVIAARVA